MGITQIVIIGIVSAILAISMKKQVPEFSLMISIAASIIIFFLVLPQLTIVLDLLIELTSQLNTNMAYIYIVLKIVGIAYITEFGAQICMDAGETAIASKIEIAGKILIMVVSVPVLVSLIDLIVNILP